MRSTTPALRPPASTPPIPLLGPQGRPHLWKTGGRTPGWRRDPDWFQHRSRTSPPGSRPGRLPRTPAHDDGRRLCGHESGEWAPGVRKGERSTLSTGAHTAGGGCQKAQVRGLLRSLNHIDVISEAGSRRGAVPGGSGLRGRREPGRSTFVGGARLAGTVGGALPFGSSGPAAAARRLRVLTASSIADTGVPTIPVRLGRHPRVSRRAEA